MRNPTSYAALALSCMLASTAHAWGPNLAPLALTTGDPSSTTLVMCADGSGGTFIAWPTLASPPNSRIQLVHLDSTGAAAPGGTLAGTPVCSLGVASPSTLALLPSTGGGLIVVWTESGSASDVRAYAARLLPSGAVAAGWNVRGLPLSSATGQFGLAAVADGAGGLLAVWEQPVTGQPSLIRAQHLTAVGTRPSGWTALGRNLTQSVGESGMRDPRLVADPAGGYWVGFRIATNDSTIVPASYQVLRLGTSGIVDPGAPVNGVSISLPSAAVGAALAIAPDGAGGAYAGFRTNGLGVRAQHFPDASGEDSNWPAGGVLLSSVENLNGFPGTLGMLAAPDGHGGVWFGWTEHRLMLGRLHDAAGPVIDAAPFIASGEAYPSLSADANGVFACGWLLFACPSGSCYGLPYLGRFTLAGAAAPGWPAAPEPNTLDESPGLPLPGAHFGRQAVMTADGVGGVVAAWTQYEIEVAAPGRFVDRFRPVFDGVLGVPLPPNVGRVSLSRAWRTGDVVHVRAGLPAGPASLELFDLLGRRMARATITSSGHEADYDFALDRSAPSGLVFVRVRQGDAQASKRFVLVR